MDTEAPRGDFLVARDQDQPARPHVLLFADQRLHALRRIVSKGFLGPLQPSVHRAGLGRRHGRRQMDQPARIDRVTAHHLQRRRPIILAHGDEAVIARLYHLLAEHIGNVELMRLALARIGRLERADRLIIGTHCRHFDQIELGIAERRQLAAEHAAGVDADRPVDPIRVEHRRVAIDHLGAALVIRCPVPAHRQTELVNLAGSLAIHGEAAHRARSAALHLLLKAGMRDDELAFVEHIVADQPIEPPAHFIRELGWFLCELLDRLSQAMSRLDVLAGQMPLELIVVVANHREPCAGLDHVPSDSQHIG